MNWMLLAKQLRANYGVWPKIEEISQNTDEALLF
jgi:hypothetical protein